MIREDVENRSDKNNHIITIDDLSLNDHYFFNKLNIQLEKIQNHTYLPSSDTPLNMSQINSDNEDDEDGSSSHSLSGHSLSSEYQIHNEIVEMKTKDNVTVKKHYRELSFDEVEKSLEKYYDYETKISSEFDILITYLNGQKHLFIQSQKITQTKLNCFMIPSLIMSAAITLFLPLSNYSENGWIIVLVSILNATITLLISLINYYRLESSQELFGFFASQYDKLQTELEVKNNRLTFIDKRKQKTYIVKEIQKLEKRMNEIKDSRSVLIPEQVIQLFPIIYHINVFSVIKKIEQYKINLIRKFRDVKNEIRYILSKNENNLHKDMVDEGSDSVTIEYEKNRLTFLIDTKENIRKQLFSYKNSYHKMDSVFNVEIKYAESYRTFFLFSSCCVRAKDNSGNGSGDSNPFSIDDIIHNS